MATKKERMATCGACGCGRPVSQFMRRDPDQQFRRRPDKPTDSFYCGCQNEDSEYDGLDPGAGYD